MTVSSSCVPQSLLRWKTVQRKIHRMNPLRPNFQYDSTRKMKVPARAKVGRGVKRVRALCRGKSVSKNPLPNSSHNRCVFLWRDSYVFIKKLGMSTSSLLQNAFLISNRWFQIFQPSLAGPRATVPPIWARSRWSITTTCSRRVVFIHPPIQFLGQREKRTGKTSGAQAGEALVAVTYSAGTDFYQL